MTDQLKGLLITTIGVLVIVPDSLLIRLIEADTMTLIALRAGISCIAMGLYFLSTGGKIGRFGRAAFLFAVTEASGTFLFVVALENTSVASTLFLVSTSPIMSAALSRIALGERISRRTIWTILGALIGIAIIASGTTEGAPQRWIGDMAALGVALSLAIAFTTVRHTPDLPVVPALTLAYALAAIAAGLFAPTLRLHGIEWLWIFLNGGVFVPVGFLLMSIGPRYITSAEVSLILLLEAVLAPLLVWAVLAEHPGSRVIFGGMIVLGVLLVSNLLHLKQRAKSN